MSKAEYFENLYQYIAQIDSDLKADDTLYQNRLAHCKKCDNLLDGMCKICGCYVELRAAMKKNTCPDISKKW